MQDLILTQIRLSDFEALVENSVRRALQSNPTTSTEEEPPPDIVDIKTASELLNLAVPTIYSLVSKREIISYKRGKKLYFKRSELLQWIESGKRRPISELKAKASRHLNDSRRE